MHPAAETAVGGGDDALLSHEVGEARDALGHELGVLDHVGGVAHDARQDQLAVGQLHVLPHLPLVLVAHVAGLERVGAALDGQHDVDDVSHGNVGGVGAVPAAPAEMQPDPVLRQALPGAIEVMKPSSRPAACSAALKLAMSALIAAWPVYVSLSTHTGQRAARGPVVMPESGSP